MDTHGVPLLDTLGGRTLATLRAFFDQQNHHPSPEHWDALADIANTLEDMADRACAPKVFLSAIDPGTGKSQTVAHFAKALTSNPAYGDVGMVIAVGRVAEAESIAGSLISLGVPVQDFAVLTAKPAPNSLGNPQPTAAQVLITTQQGIELRCGRAGSFAGAASLHFRGQPRIVRAWDEAWLPGLAVTLKRHRLYGLVDALDRLSPAMAARVTRFADEIAALEDGARIDVPDWETEFGITSAAVSAALSDEGEADHRIGRSLMAIGGRVGRVMVGNNNKATMLTYSNTLPASKTAFEKNHDQLVSGMTEMILTAPTDRWLVVIHKPSQRVGDIAAALQAALPANVAANVSTLTWGQHQATNAYAEFPRVILAGTLFTTPATHMALTHLAQNREMDRGFASEDEVGRVEQGEIADLILQAICRGRVRKSDGARCLPMDAYIIAATRHGVPRAVRTIFPNCEVRSWVPGGLQLRGKLAEAFAIVERALSPAGPGWISYADVRRQLKNMDPANFRKTIVRHHLWQQAISDRPHMEECGVGPGGRLRGVRRVDRQGDLKEAA